MLKRTVVAFGIFVAILVATTLFRGYRDISEKGATGFGFVLGSPAENLFRAVILALLAWIAFWISGKLVAKH